MFICNAERAPTYQHGMRGLAEPGLLDSVLLPRDQRNFVLDFRYSMDPSSLYVEFSVGA
jgi:hypothetical protein